MPAALTTASARSSRGSPSTLVLDPDGAAVLDQDAGDRGVLGDLHAARRGRPWRSARVVSTGLVTPSPGRCTPPTRSSVRASGTSRCDVGGRHDARPADRRRGPWTRRAAAPRAARRWLATATEPHVRNPVAWPVSASSVANSSVVYFASRVRLCVARSWPTSPAACQVVPLVSSLALEQHHVASRRAGRGGRRRCSRRCRRRRSRRGCGRAARARRSFRRRQQLRPACHGRAAAAPCSRQRSRGDPLEAIDRDRLHPRDCLRLLRFP